LKDYKITGGDSFGGVLGDVVQALIGLGYSAEEARETVKDLKTEGKDAGKLVKEALRKLGK
ncbi:MAG: RuvA C-terminal domain-containing protein, partial [Patescibacteria group bacterium]